jgi:anti-sigma factor RsiW
MTTHRPIIEDDLHAYIDGELDIERQAAVAEYLKGHPEVARRVDCYRRQRNALREVFAPIAKEPLPPALNLVRIVEKRRGLRAVRWQAVAAAFLLAVGMVAGWGLSENFRPLPAGIGALAREATENYAVYAPDRVRPVEIREAEVLARWAERRLSRPISVPDLSASGYRFMGGRLVATPHGAAVLFMYDDAEGTRIVLLSRTMGVDRDARMAPHAYGILGGFAWADKGIGYSLVGPVPPRVLEPIATAARKQLDGT